MGRSHRRAYCYLIVPDTIDETPKTAVAVMRWQRVLTMLSPPTRALVTDVLRQAALPVVVEHLGLGPAT